MMFGLSKREKLEKFIQSLTPEQKRKLKDRLETHCIHDVPYSSSLPCPECWQESIYHGDISMVMKFLD